MAYNEVLQYSERTLAYVAKRNNILPVYRYICFIEPSHHNIIYLKFNIFAWMLKLDTIYTYIYYLDTYFENIPSGNWHRELIFYTRWRSFIDLNSYILCRYKDNKTNSRKTWLCMQLTTRCWREKTTPILLMS